MHLISMIETPQQGQRINVLINPEHIITVTANDPRKDEGTCELYIKFQGESRFRTYAAVDSTGETISGGRLQDDLLRSFKSYVLGEVQS